MAIILSQFQTEQQQRNPNPWWLSQLCCITNNICTIGGDDHETNDHRDPVQLAQFEMTALLVEAAIIVSNNIIITVMLLYARHAITRVLWKRSRLKLNTKIQTKVNRGIRIREKHWGNIKLPLLAISLTNTSASPVLGCPIQLTGEVKSPEGKGTRHRSNHSILHIQADFCWIIQIRPVEVSQCRWGSSSIIQSQEMLPR